MSALRIKTTPGLKCKACDAMLGVDDFDQEMCGNCLSVVHEMNKELYSEQDEEQPS